MSPHLRLLLAVGAAALLLKLIEIPNPEELHVHP